MVAINYHFQCKHMQPTPYMFIYPYIPFRSSSPHRKHLKKYNYIIAIRVVLAVCSVWYISVLRAHQFKIYRLLIVITMYKSLHVILLSFMKESLSNKVYMSHPCPIFNLWKGLEKLLVFSISCHLCVGKWCYMGKTQHHFFFSQISL